MTTCCNTAPRRGDDLSARALSRPPRELWLGAAIAATLVFWSSAFVAISIAVVEIPPIELALFRFLVASAAIGVVVALRRGPARIRRQHRSGFLLMGLAVAGYQVTLNIGQQTVASGMASLLIATVPVMTVVMAMFALRERLAVRGWIGLGLAFAGSVALVVSRNHDFALNSGALFILLAAFLGAFYTVVQKRHATDYDAVSLAAYSIWLATLLLLPVLPATIETLAAASTRAILAAVYLGVFSSAIGYATWAFALTRLTASRVSSLLYLIPPLVFAEAWLILGTTPDINAVLSGIVILSGVALVNRRRRKEIGETAIEQT